MSPLLPSVQGLLRQLEERPTAYFDALTTDESIAAYLEEARRPVSTGRGAWRSTSSRIWSWGSGTCPSASTNRRASSRSRPSSTTTVAAGWSGTSTCMTTPAACWRMRAASWSVRTTAWRPSTRSRSPSTTAGRCCNGPTITWANGDGTDRGWASGAPPRAATCPPQSPCAPATGACPSASSCSSTRHSTAPCPPRHGANSARGTSSPPPRWRGTGASTPPTPRPGASPKCPRRRAPTWPGWPPHSSLPQSTTSSATKPRRTPTGCARPESPYGSGGSQARSTASSPSAPALPETQEAKSAIASFVGAVFADPTVTHR